MLSVVQDLIRENDWVVFHAWKPHWMVIEIDMRFLEGVPGSEALTTQSVVHTLVDNGFRGKYPEPYKFLQNFKISAMTQSQWIYEFGFQEREPEDIAREWIATNMDEVADWLEGVKTAAGEPAIEAVRAAYE
jgi:glycine betaine/proline transport system substrate-binding protein